LGRLFSRPSSPPSFPLSPWAGWLGGPAAPSPARPSSPLPRAAHLAHPARSSPTPLTLGRALPQPPPPPPWWGPLVSPTPFPLPPSLPPRSRARLRRGRVPARARLLRGRGFGAAPARRPGAAPAVRPRGPAQCAVGAVRGQPARGTFAAAAMARQPAQRGGSRPVSATRAA
jgi:hypothetical protein